MPPQTWTKETLHRHADEIADAATELERAHPADIIRWAADRVGASITVTCSFEDVVLAHVALVQLAMCFARCGTNLVQLFI